MILKRFEGKSVFITGAAGGIGRACALVFAKEGAAVTVVDREQTAIDETLALIRKDGGKGLALCCDVTQEQGVAAASSRPHC